MSRFCDAFHKNTSDSACIFCWRCYYTFTVWEGEAVNQVVLRRSEAGKDSRDVVQYKSAPDELLERNIMIAYMTACVIVVALLGVLFYLLCQPEAGE